VVVPDPPIHRLARIYHRNPPANTVRPLTRDARRLESADGEPDCSTGALVDESLGAFGHDLGHEGRSSARDVSDREGPEALVDLALERFGRVDVRAA
jgi:hypothetical protein